jgi:hypothetical protein
MKEEGTTDHTDDTDEGGRKKGEGGNPTDDRAGPRMKDGKTKREIHGWGRLHEHLLPPLAGGHIHFLCHPWVFPSVFSSSVSSVKSVVLSSFFRPSFIRGPEYCGTGSPVGRIEFHT